MPSDVRGKEIEEDANTRRIAQVRMREQPQSPRQNPLASDPDRASDGLEAQHFKKRRACNNPHFCAFAEKWNVQNRA
jgi:hypothetical protein